MNTIRAMIEKDAKPGKPYPAAMAIIKKAKSENDMQPLYLGDS